MAWFSCLQLGALARHCDPAREKCGSIPGRCPDRMHPFVVFNTRDYIIQDSPNIYPTQIEAVLNEHPKVAESAVAGMPDRLHGQCVAAYVVAVGR